MPLPVSWLALAALGVVLVLIWALATAARRFGLAPARGAAVGGPELAVAAAVALDPRRRAVLLRCGTGHVLVLTGGPQDLLLGWVAAEGAPEGVPEGVPVLPAPEARQGGG
ncbi:MAG: hypothetical protein ACP5NP_06255 [Acetobacteraceae bacterium]